MYGWGQCRALGDSSPAPHQEPKKPFKALDKARGPNPTTSLEDTPDTIEDHHEALTGLLSRNLNQVTIIQEPQYLLYVYIPFIGI